MCCMCVVFVTVHVAVYVYARVSVYTIHVCAEAQGLWVWDGLWCD